MAANASSFGISIGLDLAICVIILLFFGYFRRTQWTEKFYEPKRFTEADIVQYGGTDAAMYLRVQHFGWQLFLFCTLWCCIVLIPVHVATGTYVQQQLNTGSTTYSNLDKSSITNLLPKSAALYADWISVWVISLFIYWQLWRYNTHAVEMRIQYLNSLTGAGKESQTIMVDDIPEVNKGIVTKLAQTVTGKVNSAMPNSRSNSRTNSRTRKVTSSTRGTELEEFEDARTELSRPSDSSDGIFEGAEPMVSQQGPPPRRPNAPSQEDIMVSNEDLMPAQQQSGNMPPAGYSANPKARRMLDSGMSEEEMVKSEFEELYPGKVEQTQIAYDAKALTKHYNDFEKTKGKLETVLDKYQMKMERHKKLKKRDMVRVIGAQYGAWGRSRYGVKPQKVDALEFYPERLQELWKQIQEEQGKAKSKALSTAFVTFKDTFTTTTAATSMMHHDQRYWNTRAAPQPKDVLWGNIGLSSSQYLGYAVLCWTLFFLLAIFYLIPIAAVQALVQVDKLERFKFFKVIMDVSILSSLITAILPGIVLTIFLALLPTLLKLMNKKIQRMISESDVEFGVVRKYFAFQVITTFLGTLLAGSFLNQITAFLDNPKGIVNTLGNSAPQTATFFMTYILIQAFIKHPLQLLRLPGLIIFWLKYRLATTPRQKAAVWQDTHLKYGTNVANDTIILLIGLVYCVIQPIIAPLAMIYFAIGVLIWKYQVVYVYTPLVESGGKMWMQIFQHIITATMFFQIIMIALFGIKKAPGPAILTAPLPFITLAFLLACLKLFNKPQVIISNRSAADIDARHSQDASSNLTPVALASGFTTLTVAACKQKGGLSEPLVQQPSPSEQSGYAGPNARQELDRYISPGFTIQRQELDEVLAETEKVSPQVDAYLADNGATNGKVHQKQSRQTDDIEAQ